MDRAAAELDDDVGQKQKVFQTDPLPDVLEVFNNKLTLDNVVDSFGFGVVSRGAKVPPASSPPVRSRAQVLRFRCYPVVGRPRVLSHYPLQNSTRPCIRGTLGRLYCYPTRWQGQEHPSALQLPQPSQLSVWPRVFRTGHPDSPL